MSLGSWHLTLFVISLLCSLKLSQSVDTGLVSRHWKTMGCRDFSEPLWPLYTPPSPDSVCLLSITSGIPAEGGMVLCEGAQGIDEANYSTLWEDLTP